MIKKLKGITLLEAVLALAIATTILLFGVKQYIHYKRDRDAFSLKYNVDTLFQAMKNYYYANCADRAPGSTYTPTLTPANNPSNNSFPVDITTTLQGYLDTHWNTPNPLIDRAFGNTGYEAQFNNKVITGKRNENFCYYFPSMGSAPNCDKITNPAAVIYLWVAQIVVHVRDTTMTLALKGLADADCALQNYTPSSIVDCAAEGVTSGNPAYLVWQRLPSFAAPHISSGFWTMIPAVKVFNLQYTNDSLAELISATYAGSQYYLCGG